MIPIDQVCIHDPANNTQGDCARAVIASLMEIPINMVPNFAQDAAVGSNPPTAIEFHDRMEAWLLSQGYEIEWYDHAQERYAGKHCYISGPSPRGSGLSHAVVGLSDIIAHDPHPSRAGLLQGNWHFGYLVPISRR